MVREKKSFRKFASKHLATQIERRRKTAKGRKEQKERTEKKKVRQAKEQAKEDREHADDVAKLQETDPDFFSFLETEDPTLLEYGKVGMEFDDDADQDGDDNDDDDEDDDEFLDEDDASGKKSKKSKKTKKSATAAAAEDDGLDNIEDSETDADDDEEEQEGQKKGEEESTSGFKLPTRINKEEIDHVIKTKDMQHAVNLFVCAARELHVRDLKVSARPEEGKLLTRKFEQPSLVKEAVYAVARLVASGSAAALIAPTVNTNNNNNNNNDQNDTNSKDKKQQQKKKSNLPLAERPAGPFVHAKAKAIIGRYVLAAAAVLADTATSDESLAAVIAHSLRAFVRVIHTIRGATKRVLRACFTLCTANNEAARSAGFMVILAFAKRSAGTHSLYQSSIFKGLFLTLIRSCQQYTARSMPKVGFLLNAMVELYGTDLEAAYQHAFVYIRQLAVYLRAALQDPSQASNLRTVCNWQYLIALRTWAFVVSTYHESKQLGPLIHPVVQIALGVIDVFASPRMIPLHLHVVETLNHIAARARIFIPVAPHLMRILTAPAHALTHSLSKVGGGSNQKKNNQHKNDHRNNKHGGGGKYNNNKNGGGDDGDNNKNDSSFTDLQFMLRVKKAYARSGEYILNVWLESLYLLTEHLAHLASFIPFPEASWQVLTSLNKLKREVKVPRVSTLIINICKNIEATQEQIKQKRSRINFGPCDVPQVKMFEEQELIAKGTPMSAHYARMRQARMTEFSAKQKAVLKSSGVDVSNKKENEKSKKKAKRLDELDDEDVGDFNVSDLEEENDDDVQGVADEKVEKMGAAQKRSGTRRQR